ncbi:MAG: cellulose biosynthesis cyclic di-GMP-binding regulatory protein BcsB [Anaerolineae bacterium]|nr:cellulose biosynthesis cyclic di-GMP-binding regulatory protein BcsB [Anaerolineae bacterium]
MKLFSRFLVLLVLLCGLLLLIPARGATAVMATLTGSPNAAATGNAVATQGSTPGPAQATLAATRPAATTTRAATTAATPAGGAASTFSPLVVTAQATTAPQNGALLGQDFALTSLRVRNFELVSPQASMQFTFRVPDNWVFAGNNSLNLSIEHFLTGQRVAQVATDSVLVSTLQIRVDGQLATAVTLPATGGMSSITVPLSLAVLNNKQRTHTVDLSFEARDFCTSNIEVRVLVRTDLSYTHFEYRVVPPTLDLATLPRPFYNGLIGGQVENAALVLPAKYNNTDLEYAASLVAALGQLTGNSLQIKVTTTDKLGDPDLQNMNLLMVGQTNTHPLINELYRANLLPTTLEANGSLTVRGQAVDPNDGVVQVIAHPRNPMRAMLVLTGQTPAAVVKAVRSISGGSSALKVGGALALVSEVRPPAAVPSATTLKDRLTFAELGNTDTMLYGVGTRATEFKFYMPPGMALTSDAYVDLKFDYAETLKAARTSISLMLNDVPLTSIFLGTGNLNESPAPTIEAQKGIHQLRAFIPPGSIKNGQLNTLTLILDVQGNWNCFPPSSSVVWFNVRGESELYLPRQVIQSALPPMLVGGFPVPFNNMPDLRDLWVSLPATPTQVDLDQMFTLISRLGSETNNGSQFAPRISMGNLPDGVQTANYDFIVIGRPTTNPFLAALNDRLPQPFVPGTDQLKQVLDTVEYRLPPGYTVGVLELLQSPWAQDKAVLVITGIGETGQSYAANALLSFGYDPRELRGDVVFAAANSVSYVVTQAIRDEMWMPTTVAELATDSATLGPGAPTRALIYTVTPGPTPTITPTNTPRGVITPTSLFSPTPVIGTPTPMPTFAPLAPTDLEPPAVQRPAWVTALVLLTGGALLLTAAFGVSRLLRASRSRDRQ